MTEILTAAQMRAIEALAMSDGSVTGLELMERAGRGVVDAILTIPLPCGPNEKSAVILCGPGNNGGDGFVAARLLHDAGWDIEVFFWGDAAKLPPDAHENYLRWTAMGDVQPWAACTSERWAAQPVVIDALFGTGLTRTLPDEVRNVFMATLNCPRVAVDLPSTIATDTGALLTAMPLPSAHLTVTFHRQKMGHVLRDGPAHCGRIEVTDIGIIGGLPATGVAYLATPAPMSKRQGHKYSHGHAFVMSGGSGQGGAARLAARAALRIGAGAVTLGCPANAIAENAAQLNAVMLRAVDDATGFTEVLDDTRLNALCLGPALGFDARAHDLLGAALATVSNRAAVFDADALTLIAKDAALFGLLNENCVLTPHEGEFARLFPDLADALADPAISKVDVTRQAARRAGCVVLLKGPDTVIADADGNCVINASVGARETPWLATAGSGDVLAGFITGLMARGFPPMQAAETGAWLHTECALSFGPGLIAEDLAEELPKVFRALGI